jgi:UPF0755 protein
VKRAFLIVPIVLLLAVSFAAHHVRGLLEPAALEADPVLFEVQAGESMSRVTSRLEDAGLIRSGRAAKALARWHDLSGKLQVGEYEVSATLSPAEILSDLTSGRVKTWPVSLPEGLRASEIAERLEAAGLADAEAFLAVVNDPDLAARLGVPAEGLEGYLYPDTYHLPRGLPAAELAGVLVDAFDRAWDGIDESARASDLDRHQLVTLASIVEKETGAAEERPLIAAVFLNRLNRGMRLETDPTVIYGIEDFDGNLKRVHLEDRSNPYNTYRIRGLPPGPIANPGLDALRAVLMPAETDYLYFVSRNDGTHEFSATYKEHVAAVDEYQRRRRRR